MSEESRSGHPADPWSDRVAREDLVSLGALLGVVRIA
jgi:hypothetical protein